MVEMSLEFAEKLAEEKIKQIQSETAHVEREKKRTQDELKAVQAELKTATDSATVAKDELTKLKEQKKSIEDGIAKSQENAVKAIEKKEESANKRIEAAEKAEAKSASEKVLSMNAYSKLHGLATDLEKTAGSFVEKAQATLAGIKAEIAVLPKPEIEKKAASQPELKK